MPAKKSRSLTQVKNKGGRVDCLLFGLGQLLTAKLETKLNLPGLASGLMPLVEDEIKKNIDSKSVISPKYNELVKVIGSHLSNVGK